MVGAFVAFSLGGNWVDKHYNLNFPYFTLLGVLIALVSVFYSIFNLTKDKNE
ncbi:MAG: AtpZ/AtpI family protein [Bacteroidia bacterium]|nr:AtpZ/AtpI family protein [Bacteroidia bacterium]